MEIKLGWKLILYAGYLLIAWVIFRIFVQRDYRTRGKLSPFSAFLEVLVFSLHGSLSYLYLNSPDFKLPPLEPNPVRNWIAFILMGLGFVGVILSMTKLGYGTTLGQEGGRVRREGFYRYSRNPQIVLYGMLLLGYALLLPVWEILIWLGCYLFTAHLMVGVEEEYLTGKYGEEYRRYCRAVPRYLPRFGKGTEKLV